MFTEKTLRGNSPLSPFEERIYQHFAYVKEKFEQKEEDYEEAKKHWTTIKYFIKKDWLVKYLVDLEFFNISKLYRHIIDMKNEYGDKHERMITKPTLALFLERFHDELDQNGNPLLEHTKLPINQSFLQYVYWVPDISSQKRDKKLKEYLERYKDPTPRKKKTKTIEEQDQPHYQSQMSHFDQTRRARKDKKEILKQEQEEEELERRKQKELERQQKELEKAAENKARVKVLQEHAKKSKKTKKGSRILTEEELKANFKKNQKEIENARHEQEYQALKEKLSQEKTVSGGSET